MGHSPSQPSEQILIKHKSKKIVMDLFRDYAFVVGGKKRKEVVKLLADPRTPTELAKLLKVHPNVITRIMRDLAGRELVDSYNVSGKKRRYVLTKRGELTRQILDSLIQPRTFSELLKHLKIHHSVVVSILKHLLQHGFVTLFKTTHPTKKIYRLTRKGEVIREKLD